MWRTEEGDFFCLDLARLISLHLPVTVQFWLVPYRDNTVKTVHPRAGLRLATRLPLDLVLRNSLLAMDAGADSVSDRSQLGVLSLRAFALLDPVRLEAHISGLRIRDNRHPPLLAFLRQPAAVEQRGLATAVGAYHLATVEPGDMIVLRDVKLCNDLGTLFTVLSEDLTFGLGQR